MRPLPLPSLRIRVLHLFALSAFAIAQPAFERLGRAPEYFTVRGYQASDVLIFSIGVLVAVPLVLGALELVADRIHPTLGTILHQGFVCVLVFMLSLRILGPHAGLLTILGAALVAVVAVVVFATAYRFWSPAQTFVSFAAFAALLFVGVFLSRAHLGALSPSLPAGVTMPVVHSNVSVVEIVFDEFALSSLIRENGQIDAQRYPNFAALAQTSTWYRDTATVYDVTDRAVPAILTGRDRYRDQQPSLQDYPRNLFTLLGRSYDVRAFQAETRLCPPTICAGAFPSTRSRLSRVLSDVRTTSHWGKPLWAGDWSTPADEVSSFLASLQPARRPTLNFMHVLLPHVPYRYLPSGRAYDDARALPGYGAGYRWGKNPWYVDHNYERFLLQLGYTDHVLGQVIRKLHAVGLWNRALIVVTADHGVSFHPGGHRRYVDIDNVSDIAPVPLFVKLPGQRVGKVDRLEARSIDIVPTIADVLGVQVPWQLDGRSLLRSGRRSPAGVKIESFARNVVSVDWNRLEAGEDKTIEWKARHFGSGIDSVFAEGADRQLLGKSAASFASWPAAAVHAHLDRPRSVSFDPTSSTVPSRVTGTISGAASDQILKLAVAVNGKIAAVTETLNAGREPTFSTFVPDAAFRRGENRLAVFVVRLETGGRLALARIGSKGGRAHAFAASAGP